jgi:hypothetical protein
MNSDNTPNDQEKLRQQAEERAKLEDAIKWGVFGGEEPTPDQQKKAEESLEKHPPGGDEPCRQ